ncbi:hypothetical protein [Nguyenibacter vanlangensis]|uniref:hypothetical protein n=1 Tax=Nguyenibacter vanlangensis TaxID=1216886 RepID=UPI001C400401|nr:hypothetical protein [Nguyenibacter vanlangensis]
MSLVDCDIGSEVAMYTLSRCDVQSRVLTLLGNGRTNRALTAVHDDPADLIQSSIAGNTERLAVSILEGASVENRRPKEFFHWRTPFEMHAQNRVIVGGFGKTHGSRNADVSAADAPAWFFKGTDAQLLLNGEAIKGVGRAAQICEEAEIILVYSTDGSGVAQYAGFMFGNDVTDIVTARGQPSKLGRAKLYPTPVHPELFLGPPPARVTGRVSCYRGGQLMGDFHVETGTDELVWPVEELIMGLLSNAPMAVPGTIHMIFMGCPMNSYDKGIPLAPKDEVVIEFPDYDVRISNTLEA